MQDVVSDELFKKLNIVREYCLKRKLTVAVAESVTAGYVQALMSATPEAGLFFRGGLTVYSCEEKNRLLDIPYGICSQVNGVSPDIAALMAENVRTVFRSDVGLGITGFATYMPELGILTKYAFATVVLEEGLQYRFNFLSTKATQVEVQVDLAGQLVEACASCMLEKARRSA